MKEDKFQGSVLFNHLAHKSKKELLKYRDAVIDAIDHNKNSIYTDENGNDYKGSRFWNDALLYLDGKLKISTKVKEVQR